MLHLPLFAALAAHYEIAPTAPALVLLDEVFVGIDPSNRLSPLPPGGPSCAPSRTSSPLGFLDGSRSLLSNGVQEPCDTKAWAGIESTI